MEGLESIKISEEKKRYIVDLLNPVLEEMVAECIHFMPDDPVPFMLNWLELKKVNEEDRSLTAEEKERLVKENKELEQQLSKVKSQMQSAAKLVASDDQEEEEEDDEDDEPPPDFFEKNVGGLTKARASVSAEAYGEWNTKKTFVPPLISKTDDQKERLKSCLIKSFLFASLDANDLAIVIGAMKEVLANPKQRLIDQGDSGDFLFVVESGTLSCLIKDKETGAQKKVKTCHAGDVFGELALLYNCPRAASVEAEDKCVLWQLDRETFNHIVKEAAQKKRNRYDAFLSKVPLLQSMDAYERSQLADALKVETVEKGAVVVTQGEEGKKFYIVEEGTVVASKGSKDVMTLHGGDYFGELALIRNQPRAATVTAQTKCTLLSIDSSSVKRLLHIQDLLDRATKYT